MKGIDISEHNKYVDFNKVKNSGVDFVIIRVGWIGNKNNHTLDKYFNEYYVNAKNAGLKIGFYVYSYCRSIEAVKSGINWTLNQLNGKNFDMPLFLDMEDSSIISIGKEELTKHCEIFGQEIERHGIKAGIYANLNWFNNYLYVNRLIQYKIWLAQYTSNRFHSAKFKVDLWQYTSTGKVDGVYTNVDINRCLNCKHDEEVNIKEKGGYEMKVYQNGSTREDVYQDSNCTKKIGYLNPHETAECYGIVDGKAVIVYNMDNINNKKVGFVRWLGGIK